LKIFVYKPHLPKDYDLFRRLENLKMPRSKDLRIAVVCSSNMNRSMEAHSFLRWFDFHNNFLTAGQSLQQRKRLCWLQFYLFNNIFTWHSNFAIYCYCKCLSFFLYLSKCFKLALALWERVRHTTNHINSL